MSLLVTGGLGATAGSTYPSCLAFLITSVIADVNKITINLTSAPRALSGPAADPTKYVITSITGNPVTATAVTIVGSSLVLTTNNQSDGASYVLNMPVGGLVDVNGNPFNGPFSNTFLGVGLGVLILIAYSVDVITLDIVYNQAVSLASATNIVNYSISPTLAVINAIQLTDFTYRLTTSAQTRDQVYTVTATNVVAK
jgi:hypothetical protein